MNRSVKVLVFVIFLGLLGTIAGGALRLTVGQAPPEVISVGESKDFIHQKPYVSYRNTPVVVRYHSYIQWLPWSWEERRAYVRSKEIDSDGMESTSPYSTDWIEVESEKFVDIELKYKLENAWNKATNYYNEQRKEEKERAHYRLYGVTNNHSDN